MVDGHMRALYGPPVDRIAAKLSAQGVTAAAVTTAGLLAGIGACVAVALSQWPVALVLWLLNRGLDGLDGAVARRGTPTDLGGMLDFLADFVIYAGFLVALVIAQPQVGLAVAALLAAYLLNNVALLSFASLVEKRGLAFGDERSLRLTSGLTEGTETIIAYSAICLFPSSAIVIVWVFTAMVLFTVVQRVVLATSVLK